MCCLCLPLRQDRKMYIIIISVAVCRCCAIVKKCDVVSSDEAVSAAWCGVQLHCRWAHVGWDWSSGSTVWVKEQAAVGRLCSAAWADQVVRSNDDCRSVPCWTGSVILLVWTSCTQYWWWTASVKSVASLPSGVAPSRLRGEWTLDSFVDFGTVYIVRLFTWIPCLFPAFFTYFSLLSYFLTYFLLWQ